MSVRISKNGLKYSSSSTTEPGHSPLFKCPNCGCYYDSIADVNSLFDSNDQLLPEDKGRYLCNECGSELEITASPEKDVSSLSP